MACPTKSTIWIKLNKHTTYWLSTKCDEILRKQTRTDLHNVHCLKRAKHRNANSSLRWAPYIAHMFYSEYKRCICSNNDPILYVCVLDASTRNVNGLLLAGDTDVTRYPPDMHYTYTNFCQASTMPYSMFVCVCVWSAFVCARLSFRRAIMSAHIKPETNNSQQTHTHTSEQTKSSAPISMHSAFHHHHRTTGFHSISWPHKILSSTHRKIVVPTRHMQSTNDCMEGSITIKTSSGICTNNQNLHTWITNTFQPYKYQRSGQ